MIPKANTIYVDFFAIMSKARSNQYTSAGGAHILGLTLRRTEWGLSQKTQHLRMDQHKDLA